MDIKELVNRGIDDLSPYEPGKPIEDLERELGIENAIKLASNENPMGPSPKILDSIEAVLKETHRYPDGNATRLKSTIARKFNVGRHFVYRIVESYQLETRNIGNKRTVDINDFADALRWDAEGKSAA